MPILQGMGRDYCLYPICTVRRRGDMDLLDAGGKGGGGSPSLILYKFEMTTL